MSDDDELAGELRRLFDDERLALRPLPDAGKLIAAGAKRRRVRRRRMSVAGGALGVVALVAGGFALTGGGFRHEVPSPVAQPPGIDPTLQIGPSVTMIPAPQPTSQPPAPPAAQPPPIHQPGLPSAPPPAPAHSTPPEASAQTGVKGPVIGPGGYGKLQLNSSMEQASSVGINFTPENAGGVDGGCTTYYFSGTGVPSGGSVVVSPTRGVVYINPSVPATTPEGIGAGATREQLRKTYPEATTGPNGDVVPLGNGYRYRVVVGGAEVVEHVYLDDSRQDCYE
ncbi:hypothetical protein [Amycolatopsis albispora]|uniref:Uncharacterized protein n=1 Tax=Amycolatopsis albispora TaxID=1804986 RepID=A0A344LD24_9PSEU|nr:hypothetical protein [Amycolatopsis albispora]AXB45948.1 hypothetical protein A4R43_28590 [Amycolatopsis albispora]